MFLSYIPSRRRRMAEPVDCTQSNKKIVSFFSRLPRLRFITIKSLLDNEKHQKIGYWSDRLRKISSNFYIIAEKNNNSPKNHYHALVSVDVEIPKKWYLKGVHYMDKPVGNLWEASKPIIPESLEESEHIIYGPVCSPTLGSKKSEALLDRMLTLELHKMKNRARVRHLTNRKIWHIESVMSYLNKELDVPSQYFNYILIINRRSHRIGRRGAPRAPVVVTPRRGGGA